MSKHQQEDQWVGLAIQGNKAAFGLLMNHYHGRLTRLVSALTRNSHEIEDIVQEAFLKAYKNITHFRQEAQFYTWLYYITLHVVYDLAKSKKYIMIHNMDMDQLAFNTIFETMGHSTVPSPEGVVMEAELTDKLNVLIEKLPHKLQQCYVFYEKHQCSYEEITQLLGPSVGSIGTVRSRLHRARVELRKMIHGLYP